MTDFEFLPHFNKMELVHFQNYSEISYKELGEETSEENSAPAGMEIARQCVFYEIWSKSLSDANVEEKS